MTDEWEINIDRVDEHVILSLTGENHAVMNADSAKRIASYLIAAAADAEGEHSVDSCLYCNDPLGGADVVCHTCKKEIGEIE